MAAKIGLQLYTVRDELAKDFAGTLKLLAEIGYRHIEVHHLHSLEATAVRAMCDEFGLNIFAEMTSPETLRDDLAGRIKSAEILGNKYVVCSCIPQDLRTVEGYAQVVEIFKTAGRKLAQNGLMLCYHNHDFEFDKLENNETGFDIIYRNTPADALKAEIDVGWVEMAGHDPIAIMREFAGRVPLLHVRDIAPGDKQTFTEIGAGISDIRACVATAAECGTKYLIVEQCDNFNGSSMDSVKISLDNLTSLL